MAFSDKIIDLTKKGYQIEIEPCIRLADGEAIKLTLTKQAFGAPRSVGRVVTLEGLDYEFTRRDKGLELLLTDMEKKHEAYIEQCAPFWREHYYEI